MAAAAGDSHPWPIFNARFRVVFPLLDADGDLVTGATTPDSEVSQDQGTFADATNEATEIATSSGMYYLDLIATELDTKCTAVIVKSATAGMKTTPMVLYPRRFPVLRTGTAQAGGASTITLDAGASALNSFYNGCYVNITNNSPANALGQARRITGYVGSTKVATVEAAWGTNPDVTSTFEILLPGEVAQVGSFFGTEREPSVAGVPEVDVTHWLGTAAATPTVAGVPEVDVTHVAGATTNVAALATNVDAILTDTGTTLDGRIPAALVGGRIDASVGAMASGVVTATAIAADAIGASELAADAVTEIRSLASGTSDSGTTTTMVDAARTEADTDYWVGALIVFTSGNIAGQTRYITGFNFTTDTITFAPATTQAVATQTYEIWPTADFLRPTTTGRTLDVSTGGEAGVDWANVGSPTTAVNLSATNIDVDQIVASVSGAVGSVTVVSDKTGYAIGAGGIASTAFAAAAIDAAAIAADAIGASEIANGAIDAATFAAGAIDNAAFNVTETLTANPATGGIVAASFGAGAIDAAALAADAGTEIGTAVWATTTRTLTSGVVKKNATFSNLEFLMVDSTDHVTPKTGLIVSGTRSIDGGAFAAVSGTIAEVANGIYQIDLLAADTNGDVITYRFTGTAADATFITVVTSA